VIGGKATVTGGAIESDKDAVSNIGGTLTLDGVDLHGDKLSGAEAARATPTVRDRRQGSPSGVAVGNLDQDAASRLQPIALDVR